MWTEPENEFSKTFAKLTSLQPFFGLSDIDISDTYDALQKKISRSYPSKTGKIV